MCLASVIWQAGLKDGTGLISTESGVLKETPCSVNPSFEGQPVTNPEELIAAALASSFSMALSAELDKDGLIPENIRTAAGLMMERLESGWIITQIWEQRQVNLGVLFENCFHQFTHVALYVIRVERLFAVGVNFLERWHMAEVFAELVHDPRSAVAHTMKESLVM